MKRIFLFAWCLASCAAPNAAVTGDAKKAAEPTLASIIDRNVAARGGLQAWRRVKTLTLSGRLREGGPDDPEFPFVMQMKPPRKSRLEIRYEGKTALQVNNGDQGWNVRPFLGRDFVEPYVNAEAHEADAWQALDGPLVDLASKGTQVRLLGSEAVEGHQAYKLELTLSSGEQRRLWIDATTFLERKIDGQPWRADGQLRNVTIYYREFRAEGGVVMPHLFETFTEGSKQSRRLIIAHVTLNRPMSDALFVKPDLSVVRAAAPNPELR